ncbi:MAG: phenylalanine--tRNA ligase subunit beta [Candidatus Omnitrophota bacterium]|nr:phenylalanine--tRNA ligase subunit beta [Candidatus Omnitrophota bacterium]
MKVTYNWLRDFVKIDIPAEGLAEKLTMAGLEVTGLEKKAQDSVFEIEVTSNRPDCLSVLGLAREVAAITGQKLRPPRLVHSPQSIVHSPQRKNCRLSTVDCRLLSINIENRKDCPLYTAKIIKGVKVGPSPAWLKERLELIGCRSINNVVDITNYVLFEQGEPLHAFDLDRLAGLAIYVRRAKDNERIVAIDGEEKLLGKEALVIADKERAVAIAGIMGGKDTEVTEKTKNVLLEAAIFNPITVRHSRQGLSLQSDSAYRFERGIDLEAVESSSRRAAELIQALAQGECILAKSSGKAKAKKKSIILSTADTNKILGTRVSCARIKKILGGLGFKVAPRGKNKLIVGVPAHRQDLKTEIDLIEEVARIHGFDKIPTTLPLLVPKLIPGGEREAVSVLKNILAGLGLNEVITYSLVDRELLQGFMLPDEQEPVEILNRLSREQEVLRPHLVPSIATRIAYNLNHQQDYVNVFEVAKAFSSSAPGPKEELMLGIALCGIKSHLTEQGLVKERFGLLHLKGILEALFERLGVKNYAFHPRDDHSLIGISAGTERIGGIFILGKDLLERLGIKNKTVVAAELYLEKLFSSARPAKSFIAPPKYPGITRDISVVLNADISIQKVLQAAQDTGRPFLCSIKIADFYKGSQIPPGNIGLTISCLYRSGERTLSEEEVNPVHALICRLLEEAFNARVRQG